MSPSPLILKQVRPSAGVRNWYRARLQGLAKAMAIEALAIVQQNAAPAVAQALSTGPTVTHQPYFPGGYSVQVRDRPVDPGRAMAGAAAQDDLFDVAMRRALMDWGVRWEERFDRMARDLAKLFVDRSRRHLDQVLKTTLRDAGFTVRFQPSLRMVMAQQDAVSANVVLIRSIPRKFHRQVELAVSRAVHKGGDRRQLSSVIKRRYGVTYRRAAVIARDQAAKAHAEFESARRQDLGITTAEWLHSHAGKVPRPEHVAWGRARKHFDVTKGLWSDVDQEWQLPGTAINCRCGSRAIIPDTFVRAAKRRDERRGTSASAKAPARPAAS